MYERECLWCGTAFSTARTKQMCCCRDHVQRFKKRREYSTEKRRAVYLATRADPVAWAAEQERQRTYLRSDAGRAAAARFRQHVRQLAETDPSHPTVLKFKRRKDEGWWVRYARKRGALGAFSTHDLEAQAERQRHCCYWCKRRLGKRAHTDYQPDHVVPLALGGSNDMANIIASCPACNMRKNGKHPIEFAGRLC
jgi:hypothetical protein